MTQGKSNSIKLTYWAIQCLQDWLVFSSSARIPLLLHGKDARMRNRAFELINQPIKEINQFAQEMADKYGSKDEKGQYIKDELGGVKVEPNKEQEFMKKQSAFLKQQVVLDILPSNKETWQWLKTFLTSMERKISAEEGRAYEEILTALGK